MYYTILFFSVRFYFHSFNFLGSFALPANFEREILKDFTRESHNSKT